MKCFKGTVKTSRTAFGIEPNTWEHSTHDGTVWCSYIHKDCAEKCEAAWTKAAVQGRQARKACANNHLPSMEATPYHLVLSNDFSGSHRPCEPSMHPQHSFYPISCGWQKWSSSPVMDEQQ